MTENKAPVLNDSVSPETQRDADHRFYQRQIEQARKEGRQEALDEHVCPVCVLFWPSCKCPKQEIGVISSPYQGKGDIWDKVYDFWLGKYV